MFYFSYNTIQLFRMMITICITATLVFLLSGCGDNNADQSGLGKIVTSSHQNEALQSTLTTQSVVRLGESVPITFSVKNTSSQTVTIQTTSQNYLMIYKGSTVNDNALIWSLPLSPDISSPAVLIDVTFTPNEIKTLNDFNWSQKDSSGKQVSAGVYTILATGFGMVEQITSA